MSTWQKIIIGFLAALIWAAAIFLAHQYPDMATDFGELKLAAQAVVAGIGVYHLKSNNNTPDKPSGTQAGFARASMVWLLAILSIAMLTGCGTVNTYTGALLTHAESDYAGAKKNAQAKDDLQFRLWADAACTMPLGALARSASDNPGAIEAALKACPVPGAVVPAPTPVGSKPQPVAASPLPPDAAVPQ